MFHWQHQQGQAGSQGNPATSATGTTYLHTPAYEHQPSADIMAPSHPASAQIPHFPNVAPPPPETTSPHAKPMHHTNENADLCPNTQWTSGQVPVASYNLRGTHEQPLMHQSKALADSRSTPNMLHYQRYQGAPWNNPTISASSIIAQHSPAYGQQSQTQWMASSQSTPAQNPHFPNISHPSQTTSHQDEAVRHISHKTAPYSHSTQSISTSAQLPTPYNPSGTHEQLVMNRSKVPVHSISTPNMYQKQQYQAIRLKNPSMSPTGSLHKHPSAYPQRPRSQLMAPPPSVPPQNPHFNHFSSPSLTMSNTPGSSIIGQVRTTASKQFGTCEEPLVMNQSKSFADASSTHNVFEHQQNQNNSFQTPAMPATGKLSQQSPTYPQQPQAHIMAPNLSEHAQNPQFPTFPLPAQAIPVTPASSISGQVHGTPYNPVGTYEQLLMDHSKAPAHSTSTPTIYQEQYQASPLKNSPMSPTGSLHHHPSAYPQQPQSHLMAPSPSASPQTHKFPNFSPPAQGMPRTPASSRSGQIRRTPYDQSGTYEQPLLMNQSQSLADSNSTPIMFQYQGTPLKSPAMPASDTNSQLLPAFVQQFQPHLMASRPSAPTQKHQFPHFSPPSETTFQQAQAMPHINQNAASSSNLQSSPSTSGQVSGTSYNPFSLYEEPSMDWSESLADPFFISDMFDNQLYQGSSLDSAAMPATGTLSQLSPASMQQPQTQVMGPPQSPPPQSSRSSSFAISLCKI
jgi:hypothetical protein